MFDMTANKILFVFSDPGGAKPILAYISTNGICNYKIISDRTYDFYADFGLEVEEYILGSEKQIITEFQPDCVFTATSYTSKIELKFLAQAKRLGIQTCSFIDHYTNFKDRFKLSDDFIYPQTIFVIDQRAYEIAKSEHLTNYSNVEISGHYYHEYLRDWRPSINRNELMSHHKITADTLLLCYAAEPLSNVGGKMRFGFDETDVWDHLTNALSNIAITVDYKLVVKLHPNQNTEYLTNHIKGGDFNNFVYSENTHTNSLIYYSNIIIGICSSFLIEASMFNKLILRHLPASGMSDSLVGMGIGKVSTTSNQLSINVKEALDEICSNYE
tara:strand:+ start:244 stop:1230 length:987 start_codon:yes stop_codon:yes gene_type:complete